MVPQTEPQVSDTSAPRPFKIKLNQRPALLLRSLAVVHLLEIVAIGVYFLLLETHLPLPFLRTVFPHVHPLTTTDLWHYLVPVAFIRHGWRKVLEGIVAGAGGLIFALNPYSERRLKRQAQPPNLLDRVEMFLRIPNWKDNAYRAKKGLPPLSGPQVAMAFLVWQFVYAAPVVYALLHIFTGLRHYELSSAGPGWLQDQEALWTGPWIYLIIGFAAAPFARRPVAPVLDDMQEVFALAWVSTGRTMHWYYRVAFTPQFRERIRRVEIQGTHTAAVKLQRRRGGLKFAMVTAALVILTCFGVGLWAVITKGA